MSSYIPCKAKMRRASTRDSPEVPPTCEECELIADPTFMSLNLPPEAYPTSPDVGKQSYTRVGPYGCKIEVHYARPSKQFFVKCTVPGAPAPRSRSVAWVKFTTLSYALEVPVK